MPTMFDAVTIANIPKDAYAVAGYVNGRWPTYPQLVKDFPTAKHLSIAVTAEADADCLDVEPGDATAAQAPAWFRRQKARGVALPVFYTSLSNAKTLVGVLAAAGIKREQYRLWTAHYTFAAHLCGVSCGYGMPTYADATQYTDKALGRSLDASFLSTSFFALPPIPLKTRLRTWIFVKLAEEYSWAWIKKQPKYKLWRKLGGK